MDYTWEDADGIYRIGFDDGERRGAAAVRERVRKLAEEMATSEAGEEDSVAFRKWWYSEPISKRIVLHKPVGDTASEAWVAALREFLRRLEAPEPPEPEGGQP